MDRKLVAIRDAVSPEARERSLLAGAEIVQAEARRLVPVLTGNLQDSIIISFDGGLNSSAVSQRRFFSTVYIGPSRREGFYGHMVEFGTSHSAAHPFMRPALDNSREEVRRAMGHSLWADIKKAA
ncbi:HK97 gp10 family phage protein [Sphingobium sp. WTD-1]|uniref:HK97-gp10 family putative phage morphogenesis protein n=1 Tax=Sphingobium sp. WTD-1 TaxID=2979467 RepID=UPI0024DEA223|nr:HK97-gp10 family putative phage morphogenesis protein [Sphingobium sp. WTD-1]WIA58095.1 HK97 gp10 family phage protein [Sphingobium sp. WTD-1]